MAIRKATLEDVEPMVDLGRVMHQESPRFSQLSFDVPKVRGTIASMVDDERYFLVVDERAGELVAGFAGFVMPHWFSADLVAQDMALFVRPDKRGSLAAARMVQMFVDWAKWRGAKQIVLGISTGVHVEQTARLYQSIGLHEFGRLFEV
ncbi:MAG TPA: GNAT family N-acetyltransferase [Burkholderiaceae bacterium]|nr:GNAT family N-acetyltransferase [Burkholderiaceae bacterium]